MSSLPAVNASLNATAGVLICVGLLLIKQGRRQAHARVMIHQPAGGVRGQASDIDIQAQEILKLRDQMNEILARHTGQDVEKIASDTDRDYYMSGQEAADYGVVDRVIAQREAAVMVPDPNGSGNSSTSPSSTKRSPTGDRP